DNPIKIGKKIVESLYIYAGIVKPQWTDKLIPEDQLEESLTDNKSLIKRAFEAYITQAFDHSLSFWRAKAGKDIEIDIPQLLSERLSKLINDNRLPDIKTGVIYSGILQELYKLGVSKSQLPNLRSLADYMGCEYGIYHGYKVIKFTSGRLKAY